MNDLLYYKTVDKTKISIALILILSFILGSMLIHLNRKSEKFSFFTIGDIRYKIWYTFLESGCVDKCFSF